MTLSLEEYYKLDETSGQAINSVSPGINNSVVTTATQGTTGIIGNAYSFDGVSQRVDFADHTNWTTSTTSSLSISAWIYLTDDVASNGYANIWGHQDGPQFFLLKSSSGNYKIGWYAGNNTPVSTSAMTFSFNTWYHLVITKNGSSVNIYRNGTNVGSLTATDIDVNPSVVYIGADGHSSYEAFKGRIDELGIWKRVLTVTEVTSLYNNGSGLAYPFGANVAVTGVSVTPNPGTISIGGTLQLTANITPANATNKTVTWTNQSNEAWFSINSSGLVTAIGPAGSEGTFGAYAHNGVSGITNITITAGTPPTVTTTSPSGIAQNSATSGGNVTSAGSASVTARGVCWSTSANPTVTLSTKTSNGTGTGSFTSSITGLAANTTYHVRAYATSSVGTSYGSDVTFLTSPTTPTVTTTTPSSISQTTATCGGNVTSNGGATLTARGVCWSTSANPTVALSTKTNDGTATGAFTSSITGLTAQTTYHVRAYATNSVGTSYGSDITFATLGAPGTWQSNGSNIYYSVTGGKVGIGTTTPTTELTVNGKILAKEVEVVSSITSDHVFEPAYQLMPLTDLEIYLKQHKHLPGIPSALEFKKQGQNLGEMQDMLLRKIEELTIYIITQHNRISALEKENTKLNNQIKALGDFNLLIHEE